MSLEGLCWTILCAIRVKGKQWKVGDETKKKKKKKKRTIPQRIRWNK
jgi:hypothetical protein